jgi:ribokinase
MAGAVGDDDFGRFLLAKLVEGGVDASRVARVSHSGSGMSVAIMDAEGDYGAVIVSGANLLADPAALGEPNLWQGVRALILQNEMPEELNVSAAKAARGVGATVCLNAAPYRPLSKELRGLVDLLVVNAIEAEQLSGLAVTSLASAATAAEELSKHFPSVVVTAGGDGVAGMQQGASAITLTGLPITLVSTHGAGDTFVGALVAALAAGLPFVESLRSANEAAAAHVSKGQA